MCHGMAMLNKRHYGEIVIENTLTTWERSCPLHIPDKNFKMNGKDGRARNSFHKSASLKFDVLKKIEKIYQFTTNITDFITVKQKVGQCCLKKIWLSNIVKLSYLSTEKNDATVFSKLSSQLRQNSIIYRTLDL